MAPPLPIGFVDRPTQQQAVKSLLLERTPTTAGRLVIIAIYGIGGIGKSVLAAAIAQDPEIQQEFPDGILWTTLGQTPNLSSLLNVWIQRLTQGTKVYTPTSPLEPSDSLQLLLENKQALLIVDDVWKADDLAPFIKASSPACRILVTTREAIVLHAQRYDLDVMEPEQALEFLLHQHPQTSKQNRDLAAAVAKEVGYLPLALDLATAQVKHGMSWQKLLDDLRKEVARLESLEQPGYETQVKEEIRRNFSIRASFNLSLRSLTTGQLSQFAWLGILPEDVMITQSIAATLWGTTSEQAGDILRLLKAKSLLMLDSQQSNEQTVYRMHDLMHDTAKRILTALKNPSHLDDLPGLELSLETAQAEFLNRYWNKTQNGQWHTLPDDGYVFEHLGYHLRGAGQENEWRKLLVSFNWLERKTEIRGFPDVLLDLATYPVDVVIAPLYRVFRRAAHILTNDPAQFAAQMLARIDATPELDPFLKEAKTWHGGIWLRPVTPSLRENGEPTLIVFRGREEDGHAGTPHILAFSTDGKLIASAGGSRNDLTVKVWSFLDAKLLRTYLGAIEAGSAAALTFVSQSRYLAVAKLNEVHLYAIDKDEPVARHTFDNAYISCICGNDRTSVLYIGFHNGCVLAWDPMTDTKVELREPNGESVIALAHATDSPHLVVATDSVIECHNVQNRQLIGQINETVGSGRFTLQAPPVAITSNGSRVFFANPMPRAWAVSELESRVLMETFDTGPVVALTNDGTLALTAPDDRELVSVEIATGRRISHIRNYREFSCLALAPDARVVATGDYEHDIKLWNLTYAEIQTPPWPWQRPVGDVAICDDPSIAFVAADGMYKLWNTATGNQFEEQDQFSFDRIVRRCESLLDQKKQNVRDRIGVSVEKLVFSQAAGLAVSVSRVQKGKYSLRRKNPDIQEPPARFGGDYPLQVWDLKNTKKTKLLHGHTMPISCLDMTVDGTRAITGSVGRLLRLWDLETGECLQVLRGHRGAVYSCALTEDARFAISGSEDMTVRLWDLTEGRLLFTFATSSAVTSCDIARDGSIAIAGEVSGRIHTFSVER